MVSESAPVPHVSRRVIDHFAVSATDSRPRLALLKDCSVHRIAEFSIEAEADLGAQRVISSKTYTSARSRGFFCASAQPPLQDSFECNNASELEIFDARRAELLGPSPSMCIFGTRSPSSCHNFLMAQFTKTSSATMASTSAVPPTHARPELDNKQNREWGVLTSSWPSARPSPPLVFRPWLRCQCPSCRIVLRRLDPLRLSCSFFSFKKSPQRLSRVSPMESTRAQLLSSRVFDVDNRGGSNDDVGWMNCFAGTRLGCAGLCSRVGL